MPVNHRTTALWSTREQSLERKAKDKHLQTVKWSSDQLLLVRKSKSLSKPSEAFRSVQRLSSVFERLCFSFSDHCSFVKLQSTKSFQVFRSLWESSEVFGSLYKETPGRLVCGHFLFCSSMKENIPRTETGLPSNRILIEILFSIPFCWMEITFANMKICSAALSMLWQSVLRCGYYGQRCL